MRYLFLCSLIFLCTACLPPRCKIPSCHVIVDHTHPRYGQSIQEVPENIVGLNKRKAKKVMRNSNLTGQETGVKKVLANSPLQYYRGLPWYVLTFRKKTTGVDENGSLIGKFRPMDERELQKFRKYKQFTYQKSVEDYARYLERQAKKEKERNESIAKYKEQKTKKAYQDSVALAKEEEEKKKKSSKLNEDQILDVEKENNNKKNKKDKEDEDE